MIITISGKGGSGKSTIAKLLAKKLDLKHYSIGDFMRQMAEEKRVSIFKFSDMAEEDKSIDNELDDKQRELGQTEDDFVIDSRLGFHFIKNSIKVFLDANFETRAGRILGDKTRKEKNTDLEQAKKHMLEREESEKKRYKEHYELDPYNVNHYDLVIDTSVLTPHEVVDQIREFIEK